MTPRLARVAPLFFFSGCCALIYQTVWLREFRLFFGASTAATAAVLAVFMGGLGLGSALLGKRSEAQTRPLRFYAHLELLIAVSALLTPVLLWGMRQIYLALGGTLSLGMVGGTLVRLLMSAIVLGIPTFLMGGTLPAAARAVVAEDDTNRRPMALLYGVNTLGAVCGTLVSTFFLLEAWGNRLTLVSAACANLGVAGFAFYVAKNLTPLAEAKRKTAEPAQAAASPPAFVFVASAVAGFAFLLMELVWYRMLCGLLNASTFTFGLILAVALAGIGIGGLIYTFWFAGRRVTLSGFAFVSALEALLLALPYALGDRVAILAMLLRSLGVMGFAGFTGGWTVVCLIVVFPTAVISGIQFPMLVALLGKGRAQVGAHTGMAYAWNTAGAIAGSLAGGFGLLPVFSAPGVWGIVVVLLGGLSVVAVVLDLRRSARPIAILPPVITAAVALWMLSALGPTAFWRHAEIGVGRIHYFEQTPAELHDLINSHRRDIAWEKDGIESSVALSKRGGFNFIVNGRCDGNLRADSGTQIMMGLIPALLDSNARRGLVVGLGTGSTAGWLAAVPGMESVDVFELEPAILDVAEACTPMNHQVMTNPKVHIHLGDAREMLLCVREKYDLIVSEPSNPYRAGVANLFTREYYESAAKRLSPNGCFAQWLQAYEVDEASIETIYATLHSVFPVIETWQTGAGDLLLVGRAAARSYDADEMNRRFAQEPFHTAALKTWFAVNLENYLAHFVADNSIAVNLATSRKVPLNTDDKTVLEFAFARNVSRKNNFNVGSLRMLAAYRQADRLPISQGTVDWDKVNQSRSSMGIAFHEVPNPPDYSGAMAQAKATAIRSYLRNDLSGAMAAWRKYGREPGDLGELLMVADCTANEGAAESGKYISALREYLPLEAEAFAANLAWKHDSQAEATALVQNVLSRLHDDPWLEEERARRFLLLVHDVVASSSDEGTVHRIFDLLRAPFGAGTTDGPRLVNLFHAALAMDQGKPGSYVLAAIDPVEPFVPWQRDFLRTRVECYRNLHHPRLATAEADLKEFDSQQDLPRIRPGAGDAPAGTSPSASPGN